MLVGGIRSNHYESLIELSTKKPKFIHKLTIFFNRLFFFLFKTHHWESNHCLINRICSEWNSLETSEKVLKFSTIKNLADKFLKCKNSSEDLPALKGLRQTLKAFKQNHPQLIPPKPNNFDEFEIQVRAGAQKLIKHGLCAVDLDVFSCFVLKILIDTPVAIIATVRAGNKKIAFELYNPDGCESLILPICSADNTNDHCKRMGIEWSEYGIEVNRKRVEAGKSPFTKLFFPFVVPGCVKHAILGVVELKASSQSSTKITIIDSLGKNSGYLEKSEAFAEGLKSGFMSEDKVIFNSVKQQTDGLTCGYQMFLNIRDLVHQPDVQELVERKGLPVRPLETIKAFVEELIPSLKEFVED